MSWSLGLPVPVGDDPVQVGINRRLELIEQILDESRDPLDRAVERHTAMEASLRRAEGHTRDLQWDAAKILLDNSPSRPAKHTVEDTGDQLTSDLRRAQVQAVGLHDTLRQSRRHLEHAVPLVHDLTQLTHAIGDPEEAVAAAMLATRLGRLTTLVELAAPLAERTGTRIEDAHQALSAGLRQIGNRSTETFQQFWNLDHSVFHTAREIAHARSDTRHGADLTEHAVNAVTVTAAHTRDLHHQRRSSPHQPAGHPNPAPAGSSI